MQEDHEQVSLKEEEHLRLKSKAEGDPRATDCSLGDEECNDNDQLTEDEQGLYVVSRKEGYSAHTGKLGLYMTRADGKPLFFVGPDCNFCSFRGLHSVSICVDQRYLLALHIHVHQYLLFAWQTTHIGAVLGAAAEPAKNANL